MRIAALVCLGAFVGCGGERQAEFEHASADAEIEVRRLGAFDRVELLEPTSLPAGWLLHQARVLPVREAAEGCEQVSLHYGPPAQHDLVRLYQLPPDCLRRVRSTPADQTRPIRVAGMSGWVATVIPEGVGVMVGRLEGEGRNVIAVSYGAAATDVALLLSGFQPVRVQ
jgi:hypothetical protein